MLKSKSAWKVTRSWRSERSDGGRSKHVARSGTSSSASTPLPFSNDFGRQRSLQNAVVSFVPCAVLFGIRPWLE